MTIDTPRHTAFWRGQGELLLDGLREAWSRPVVLALWDSLKRVLRLWAGGEPEWSAPKEYAGKILRGLAQQIREVSPALDHAFGPRLEEFLADLAFFKVGLADEFKPKLHHLLPDNPVERGDGSWTGLERAEKRHLLQLASAMRAFRPEGQRGRPRKPARESPTRASRAIDPAEADRAYRMHSNGYHWTKIALALGMQFDRADHRSRERARQMVQNRIARGLRNAVKTIPAPKNPVLKK
jgi:hypothetical protein